MKIVREILFLFGWLLSTLNCYHVSAQDTIKILPLGNSITEGYTDGSLTEPQMRGYRYGLRYLLQHAGYQVDFVGSQSAGSDYFSDCQHAGIGGTRDQYIVRLLTDGYDERNGIQILVPPRTYLDEYNPDIILLHIGTNDITQEGSAAIANQKVTEILNLVDQYEARAEKEVLVFLALIINRIKPWTPGSPAEITSSFNNAIKSMAQSRIAAGDKIVIVDMENDAGFLYSSEDMANDGEGIHPNDLGYSKMANLWFSSIFWNYNTSPVISAIPDQTVTEGNNFGVINLDDYVTDIEDPDENIIWTAIQPGTGNLDIVIDASRQATIAPLDEDWNGSQTVIFTATDNGRNGGHIKSDVDTVVYTVTPVNDPPVITSSAILVGRVNEQYSYTFTAIDVDNPVITKSAVQIPSWLSFSSVTGLLQGTPASGDKGPHQVILRASDGIINTDQTFTITVSGETGLSDLEKAGIHVYPNPASCILQIEFEKPNKIIQIDVHDLTGNLIRKIQIPENQTVYSLDLQSIEPGIYLLHIYGIHINCIDRLVINK
jgi:lysophospholipase L1-like esterase